jgi:flagellar hook-associated protein 1 FlgK
MSNWFAALGQAASGMNAARYGLSVVGQNIANANSDGYTRQVVDQQSAGFTDAVGIYTHPSYDGIGGVQITGTHRVDDTLLDTRVRNEHAKGSYADTVADQLSSLEQLFPVASDDSLATQLTSFWKDWSTVANNPSNPAARQVLLQHAQTLVGTLNSLSASLADQSNSAASYLGQDVGSVNSAASSLADLNQRISIASATGTDVNALLDQRDQLLDKLSKLAGATATLQQNGSADVSIGGVSLVSGGTANSLSLTPPAQLSIGANNVTVGAGSIGARATAIQVTLPNYQSQLDGVADALATTVNAVQAAGYDLAGNVGAPIFSGSGAAGLSVVMTDPTQIAASATPGGNLDGSNAQAAARLATSTSGADYAYSALVGAVGAQSAAAKDAASTQDALVSNAEAMHASVSGVSYDEEVTNLLTYQRAFQASSKALTTIDEMLDVLINHTGHVGAS